MPDDGVAAAGLEGAWPSAAMAWPACSSNARHKNRDKKIVVFKEWVRFNCQGKNVQDCACKGQSPRADAVHCIALHHSFSKEAALVQANETSCFKHPTYNVVHGLNLHFPQVFWLRVQPGRCSLDCSACSKLLIQPAQVLFTPTESASSLPSPSSDRPLPLCAATCRSTHQRNRFPELERAVSLVGAGLA